MSNKPQPKPYLRYCFYYRLCYVSLFMPVSNRAREWSWLLTATPSAHWSSISMASQRTSLLSSTYPQVTRPSLLYDMMPVAETVIIIVIVITITTWKYFKVLLLLLLLLLLLPSLIYVHSLLIHPQALLSCTH